MRHGEPIRYWCEAIARECQMRRIPDNGTPYLERYFVRGWSPGHVGAGPGLFLHHFLASDPADSVHSHPWHAVSVILVGAYREYRCTANTTVIQDYHEGDINRLSPADRHRIDLLTPDVWTLFLVGDYEQPWAFFPVC